jgi:hypothetical protein
MSRSARGAALAATLATMSLLSLGAGAIAASTPRAHAAHSVSVKDEGYLHFIRSSGSLLIDEGPTHGTIPGTANIHFVYDGNPSVNAQITINAHAGRIWAHGSGRMSNPTSARPSFKGTLTITGGSGRYAHAHGGGSLFGVFYRRSYAITVQTEGTLHY